MYGRGAWFLRVIMSSSRTLCWSKKIQSIIKQLLGSVFCDSRIIEVSVRVISLGLRLRHITPTLNSTIFFILDITRTSSNNCLKFLLYWRQFSCACFFTDHEFHHNLVITSFATSWIHSYFDNVMTKFIVNNWADALKTDINLFFTITKCQVTQSCALTHLINYKSVSIRVLTIQIRQ